MFKACSLFMRRYMYSYKAPCSLVGWRHALMGPRPPACPLASGPTTTSPPSLASNEVRLPATTSSPFASPQMRSAHPVPSSSPVTTSSPPCFQRGLLTHYYPRPARLASNMACSPAATSSHLVSFFINVLKQVLLIYDDKGHIHAQMPYQCSGRPRHPFRVLIKHLGCLAPTQL